jgi:hypothetical protein
MVEGSFLKQAHQINSTMHDIYALSGYITVQIYVESESVSIGTSISFSRYHAYSQRADSKFSFFKKGNKINMHIILLVL